MIAVQAETARLTTPGLPAAGAQRLRRDRRHRAGRADRDAPAARRAPRGRRGRGCHRRRPAAAAGAAPAQRADRRGPGGLRHGRPADPVRAPSPSTRASSWPPTGSCRRLSPTPGGTRRAPRSTSSCTTGRRAAAADPRQRPGPRTAASRRQAAGAPPAGQPAPGRQARCPAAGTGCPACASGPGGRRRAAHRRRPGRRIPGRGRPAGETGDPMTGIVVADDHEVVRAGFAALLGTQPDFDGARHRVRRGGGGGRLPRAAARRRADGRADAGHRRHRGDQAAHAPARTRPGCSS